MPLSFLWKQRICTTQYKDRNFDQRIGSYRSHIERENLVITIGFLGKFSQNNNIHYKCSIEIEDVIEGIASKGVYFIKPPKFSPESLAGLSWELDKLWDKKEKSVVQPTTVEIYEYTDGRLSVTFGSYINSRIPKSETSSSLDGENAEYL